ncbi:hypothetical protein BUE67_15335 [Corynebacterium diphtheriae]|nr:hypothetical protein BUE67_15335 [Corynebacterium diphtheriae]
MITAEKKKKNKFLPNFEKQSIYSLRYDEMQNWLVEHGQQKFRAKQILPQDFNSDGFFITKIKRKES